MAALVPTRFPLPDGSPLRFYHLRKPKPPVLLISCSRKTLFRFSGTIGFSGCRNVIHLSPAATGGVEYQACSRKPINLPHIFVRLAVSVVLCIGFGFCIGIRVSSASSTNLPASSSSSLQDKQTTDDDHEGKKHDNDAENVLDKDLEAAFNSWNSKTYALTVPLKIVALRGSVPPSWIKDFIKSQGKRLKFDVKHNTSLAYLRRNSEGEIDPNGDMWAAPYRWSCMVIAYKKNKFQKYNLAPIEDWADLWRPEFAGRISMVDSPREVIGAILKYMGASYNTNDINSQVDGGRDAVKLNLSLLGKQAIPAASRIQTNRIDGRIRGPSPLIRQWIEFCLQAARALPFKQEVVPGASPKALQAPSANVPTDLSKGRPKLDTNLIAGAPPPKILDRCEFLEPLSDSTISDYRWLLAAIEEHNHGLIHKMRVYFVDD